MDNYFHDYLEKICKVFKLDLKRLEKRLIKEYPNAHGRAAVVALLYKAAKRKEKENEIKLHKRR